MKIEGVDIERPIFIIGVGRSGTTLLMTMLNAHSIICFPPEVIFLKDYLCRLRIHKIVKGNKAKLIDLLMNDSRFEHLGIRPEDVLDKFNLNEFTLKKYYQNMLWKYAKSKNKRYVGDKYPRNLEILLEIKYLFPDAYIIHIIRDPRAVISSRMKTWWGKKRNFIAHIAITREMLNLAAEQGLNLFGQNYHELRYEDLVSKPEEELKRICDMIGVHYEPNMLNFQQSASEIIQQEELDFKYNNLRPLNKEYIYKWKKELKKFKIILVEAGCLLIMKKYEYDPEFKLFRVFFIPFNIIYFVFGKLFRIHQKFRFWRLLKYRTFTG